MSALAVTMPVKVVNGWSGTAGCGPVTLPLRPRSPNGNYSGRVIAAAWDFLVKEFGEEIIPELAEQSVKEVVEIYLTL